MPESPDQPHRRTSEQHLDAPTPAHRAQRYRHSHQAGPSHPFRPADPLRRRWHNAALRIGTSDVVHAIRFARSPDGERVGAACRTGHDRADNGPDLVPIRFAPVSCQVCRTSPRARADGQPYDPNQNQYVLHAPGMPLIPVWPPRGDEDPNGHVYLLF